jgi:hypothetical protein
MAKWTSKGIRIGLLVTMAVLLVVGYFLPSQARAMTVTEAWDGQNVSFRVTTDPPSQLTLNGGSGVVEFIVGNSGAGSAGVGPSNVPTYLFTETYPPFDSFDLYTWAGTIATKDEQTGKWWGSYFGVDGANELTWMAGVPGFETVTKAFMFSSNPAYSGSPDWQPLNGLTTYWGFYGSTQILGSPFAAHVINGDGSEGSTLYGPTTGVPEPATLILLISGFAGLVALKRRLAA